MEFSNMRLQPGIIIVFALLIFWPGAKFTDAASEVATSQPTSEKRGTLVEVEAVKSSILKSDTINDKTFLRSQSKRAAAATSKTSLTAATKSLALISTTTQITKENSSALTNGGPTTTATTAATTHTNASLSSMATTTKAAFSNSERSEQRALEGAAAISKPLAAASNDNADKTANSNNKFNNGIINNISNNSGQRSAAATAATTAATTSAVTAALEANLIMSNRNVEEHKLDEHKYRITQDKALPIGSGFSTLLPSASSIEAMPKAAITTDTTTTATTTTAETTTAAATTTTTTVRTTRRPVPTTTLKPPPTIDDYQTIISQAGTHAYLPCNVKQLVKKPISWLRMRDGHILTVDQTTFIADQRFQSVFSPNPERWSLQIKYVQLKDEGIYECQVSTEPKASAIVHLRIVEPKTELIGESTRHVKAGSQVKLRCIISQALEPPLFINWFYNQKQIYLHNRRGWRTEIERIDLPTEAPTTLAAPEAAVNGIAAITRSYILDAISVNDVLPTLAATATAAPAAMATEATAAIPAAAHNAITTTAAATATAAATMTTSTTTTTTTTTAATTTTTELPTTSTTTMLPSSSFIKQITTASLIIPAVVKLDSGNYTCSPSNSAPRTIVLHVLNGEYSASAIKSGSVSWNTLIGSRGGYLQWRNVSTILTLCWIIKFLIAGDVAICSRGRNKVNNPTTPQESATGAAATTLVASRFPCNDAGSDAGSAPSGCHRVTNTQANSRRQRREGCGIGDGGFGHGHVNSSISGTKVAEDKT